MSPEAKDRLTAMVETTDGFVIAERDLQLRGAGDFFGTRQAGMPTFRMIDLDRDGGLMDEALQDAEQSFPIVVRTPMDLEQLLKSWSARFRLMEVG